MVEEVGVGVLTRSLVLEPVAALAERRARRATNEKLCLADAEPRRTKKLACLHRTDISLENLGIGEICSERGGGVRVIFDCGTDAIACALDAEIETAGAAEEAYGWQLKHPPLPSCL